MGSISDYLEDALLDHTLNGVTYTPAAAVYLGYSVGFSVRSASYQWTASGSGTSEYYLEASGGGDPSLPGDPGSVIINGADATKGTLGSLAAGEWGYGDNDTLGFSTIYVRLSDGTDPDTKAAGYVIAGADPLDDESGLNEPAGGNYSRKAITFGAAASRTVTQSGNVTFDQANAEQGWATHWVVFDADTAGNVLASGMLGASKHIVNGNTPSIATTEVYVAFNAGKISDYLAEAWLDFAFRNQAFASPDVYVALTTATIADTDTGSTITEHSGDGYAREQVNVNGGASPTWDLAVAGVVDNTHDITIGPASGGTWGTCVASALVDADTAGNLLLYANDMADQAVGDGDSAVFPAGDLDVSVS